jgi:hypothetical protein
MIGFLSPLFLLGAAAAAVPILLHLLKRHPEARVRFSAVKLLQQVPVEHVRRRHLRELLLLALRIAALILLAVAFARPFVASADPAGGPGVTVVALDTSLSMAAPGQFERARELAHEAVRGARASELVAVVTFDASARVSQPPTLDRALADAVIREARPLFGATRYRAPLAAALDLIGERRGTIVVVSDLQQNGWATTDAVTLPDRVAVEVRDTGEAPPNLAVTAVRIEGSRLVATVRNAGPSPREARVRRAIEGGQKEPGRARGAAAPGAEATVLVGPGGVAEVVFDVRGGRWAAVEVDDPDGIEGDNVRYIVTENEARPQILVVSASGDLAREGFYVQQALTAASGTLARIFDVEGVRAAQLSAWDRPRLERFQSVVLLSTRGLERRARLLMAAYIRNGGGVLVAAGQGIDGDVLSESLGDADATVVLPPPAPSPPITTLAPADARHPVFAPFRASSASLGLVRFRRAATIHARGCDVLARFTTGAVAIADCPSGAGRVVILASDLDNDWNDFPLHATFVPFVHGIVWYLGAGRVRSADYLVDTVPAGVAPRPDVTSAPDGDGGSRLVAVNVDPAESEPARLTEDGFRGPITTARDVSASGKPLQATEREEAQHIWQYLLALMLAALVAEGLVARRVA